MNHNHFKYNTVEVSECFRSCPVLAICFDKITEQASFHPTGFALYLLFPNVNYYLKKTPVHTLRPPAFRDQPQSHAKSTHNPV